MNEGHLRAFRKFVAVLLLCALVSLSNAQPATAQGGEIAGRPWWMGALSFALSVFAISSVGIGVVELAKDPKMFWAAQIFAVGLLAIGLLLTDVGTIFFWMGVLVVLTIIIVDVALFLIKTVVKRVVK